MVDETRVLRLLRRVLVIEGLADLHHLRSFVRSVGAWLLDVGPQPRDAPLDPG